MADSAVSCLFGGLTSIIKLVWNRFTCNSVQGVVIPASCGKTTLVKQLQSRDNSLIVDFEEFLRLNIPKEDADRIVALQDRGETVSANLILYPIARDTLKELKKNHRFKRIIIVTSDLKLLEYMGVKSNIILAPTSDFFTIIQSRIDSQEEKALNDQSRTDILLASKNKLIPYASWDALRDIICSTLKLVPKL